MQNVNQLLANAQQAQQQGNPDLALQHYQQVLLQYPNELNLHIVCGNLCVELQRFEESAGYFRRILSASNKNNDARNALCFALQGLGNQAHHHGRFAQAEACFEEATQHQPGNAVYWYNLGNAQRELGKPQAALTSFKKSLALNPNDADTYNNLGNVQRELGQLDKAIASYEKALQLNSGLHHALAHLVHQKQHVCDWAELDTQIQQLRNLVKNVPNAQISPFAFLAMPGTTAAEQKQCASNWVKNCYSALPATRSKLGFGKARKPNKKINIGYLSADFRLHPLAYLITELIENHDRNQFEVAAYSYGQNDKTATRRRLEQAFVHFVDIRNLNDLEAAKRINQDQVDILVDLTGFTQSSRTGIVALKPAPISINWLGYPGTMGELEGRSLFDYILADKVTAPNAADFSEQLLYLPCYQPNDSKRPVGKLTTKTEHNLPENAFVFCCFNQTFKITAEVFAVWLRLLQQVPNSVLWLLECNPWAKTNLWKEAEKVGIDKNRLIFAPRVAIAEHLVRHVHADLFLDTLPYNAHTTASDALFMRLPLLTCAGETFASRVAASLLRSVNLPELVTNSLLAYEQKALDFAQYPEKLAQLKQKLCSELEKSALFNPALFARELEQHYLHLRQAM
ncbi:MAG TPA: tetratricopeptide repeat protein [Methylotenera sp.]|nr:tetratricopeptide repeat protein [Methylotenera sp.]HPV44668.1 tetratricopeptide repeat protein [Methylotenera sp.]